MKIILDTASIEDIKKYKEYLPICGVTTNPSLVAKEGNDFFAQMKKIREVLGPDMMLNAEVTSLNAEDMVKEAKYLTNLLGPNTYIKIPCSLEGFKAMKMISGEVNINATTCFSVAQAVVAAKCGAKFVSPFVGRLCDIGEDGPGLVFDIVTAFTENEFDCEVLAASFRNREQVEKCILAGCDAVTINPKIIEEVLHHDLTDKAISMFNDDWNKISSQKIVDMI